MHLTVCPSNCFHVNTLSSSVPHLRRSQHHSTITESHSTSDHSQIFFLIGQTSSHWSCLNGPSYLHHLTATSVIRHVTFLSPATHHPYTVIASATHHPNALTPSPLVTINPLSICHPRSTVHSPSSTHFVINSLNTLPCVTTNPWRKHCRISKHRVDTLSSSHQTYS
jgi:hypothetical protein